MLVVGYTWTWASLGFPTGLVLIELRSWSTLEGRGVRCRSLGEGSWRRTSFHRVVAHPLPPRWELRVGLRMSLWMTSGEGSREAAQPMMSSTPSASDSYVASSSRCFLNQRVVRPLMVSDDKRFRGFRRDTKISEPS